MLKAKDNIKLPHHFDIGNFIHDSRVSIQDIAKNIVNEQYPNGMPADYLNQLIKNGLDDNDAKVVYNVTTELCNQQKQRDHQKARHDEVYHRKVTAKIKRQQKRKSEKDRRNAGKQLKQIQRNKAQNNSNF